MEYLDLCCPICGSRAFVKADTPDGYYMGWSVGCPRYHINDGIHAKVMTRFNLSSRKECIEWWKGVVENG